MPNLLSKEQVISDYNLFKSRALKSARERNWKESISYVEVCAKLAYNFNFQYYDEELEKVLVDLSSELFPSSTFIPQEDRFVFYDYFGFDNKGLTQQYIRALMSWNVEFLYILEEGDQVNNGNDILQELEQYSKASILLVKGKDSIQKMSEIHSAIVKYKPARAFLHFVPWDVIGVSVWNSLSVVKRFLINLTDHAFWLGKSCSDHYLEFRNYGYNVSVQARNIPEDRLLFQPYYPIQNSLPFQGFPVDITGKVVGFSGSAYYKIGGRQFKFLKLVKRIIEENPNFIFLLAGGGDDKLIKKFINENGLEKSFILIGARNDINEVFKRIDIFINTYPLIGGLMTQLAVLNKKAIISYTTPDLPFNFVEDFLPINEVHASSIKDERIFFEEISHLISDPNYRLKNSSWYQNSVPTVGEFNNTLRNNVYHLLNEAHKPKNVKIDYEAFFQLYLETENEFLKNYDILKLQTLNKSFFKRYPFKAISSTLNVMKDHPEILFKYIKKKLESVR